jgi:hypothetical protein
MKQKIFVRVPSMAPFGVGIPLPSSFSLGGFLTGVQSFSDFSPVIRRFLLLPGGCQPPRTARGAKFLGQMAIAL